MKLRVQCYAVEVLPNGGRRNHDASFRNSSLAIRSSPQVGLSRSIRRINPRRFFGSGGVKAARVTADYDDRFGANSGPWTTEMFVEAVYTGLKNPPKAAGRN